MNPKTIIGFLLIGIGVLSTLFFKGYHGTAIPYPILLYLISLALISIGYYLIKISRVEEAQKRQDVVNEEVERLKSRAEKITVDLSKFKVRENSYSEIRDTSYGNHGLEAFNEVVGSKPDFENVNIVQSVITCDINVAGEVIEYVSPVIAKDKQTLLFKLLSQKETTLYIDRETKEFYLDLEFLQD